MKKLLICLLAFQLTACASVQKFNDDVRTTVGKVVTPDNLDTVEAAYGSALAAAIAYRNLCERRVINKSCWNVIAILQPYESKAYNALKVAQNFVQNNPVSDASTWLQYAKDAIAAFKAIEIQYGVK